MKLDQVLAFFKQLMTFFTGVAVGSKIGENERQDLKKENMTLGLSQKELDVELQTERDFSGKSTDDNIAASFERLRPKKPDSE